MHQLLECLSLALNLGPQDALSQHHTNLPFTLDLIHYPAISISSLRSGECVRCPAHSDFGSLTLLFQDNTGGLEIADMSSTTKETSAGVERTARFLHIDPIPGTIVVNVGYLLMRWSNGRWRSAVHRVSEPPSKRESEEVLELAGGKSIRGLRGEGNGTERICPERYSVAFFSTPDHETMVDALPGCWSEEVPKKWEPINVGEYISRKRKAVYS
jgi:isopenicillin N synthase-like dioxygenase